MEDHSFIYCVPIIADYPQKSDGFRRLTEYRQFGFLNLF